MTCSPASTDAAIGAVVPPLLDLLDVAVCAFDAETRAVAWNETFLAFFPEHRGHVHVGEPYADNLRRFYRARLDEAELPFLERYVADGIARHLAQIRPFAFEHRGRWVRVASHPTADGGRVRIWREIPPPTPAAAAAGSPALHTALDGLPEGVMVLDSEDRIVYANPRLLSLYGIDDPGEVVGRALTFFLERLVGRGGGNGDAPLATREWIYRTIEHRRFSGVPFEVQLPGPRWVRVIETRAADGGAIALHTEITEIKQHEADLAAARQAAEAASTAKSRFLATMSHELRTPMTGVIGMIGLLRESGSLTPEQERWLSLLSQSADGMMTVLGDILDLSKIEAGSLALDTAEFAPRALADEVVGLFAGSAAAKGLALVLDWVATGPERLIGDATRIRQILANLVGNAVKFTEAGSVTVRVADVRPVEGGRWSLRFEVVDTGPGIAPEQRARLFQPFAQGDATIARRFGGTGLGLAICRRLVEAMDGRIDVDSEPGRGARFWFEIALTPDKRATVRAAPADPAEAPPALRILVAEDDGIIRLLLGALLEEGGHAVAFVEDGRQAVEALLSRPFDLVLMDIHMPVTDGVTATREIRALPPPIGRTPVIALSADAIAERRAEYMKAGFDDYLTKPIRPQELARALARAVAGRTLPHALVKRRPSA